MTVILKTHALSEKETDFPMWHRTKFLVEARTNPIWFLWLVSFSMGILPADDKPWRSLTQSEASEIVGVINEAIKKRDGSELTDCFDEARYVGLGARGFDVPEKVLESLRAASTRTRGSVTTGK